MEILQNVLLAPYTTFKIGGSAKYFCVVKDQFEALEAYEFAKKHSLNVFVLGGGSNLLVSDQGFNGLVVNVVNKGIQVLSQNDKEIFLKVASGELWDEVVKFAVSNNWWGIENLSHIPGRTGAIAVQNVGAYGQEAGKVIESVDVFNKESHNIQNIKNWQCHFTYRKSIFNSISRGKFIIFYIILKLQKDGNGNFSYRDLENKFKGKEPTLSEIRQAIIEIRNNKFPFPTEAVKGNAGSFFKNPLLSLNDYGRLRVTVAKNFGAGAAETLEKKKFIEEAGPPFAKATEGDHQSNKLMLVKVPAAYLLELCGLKDLEVGGAAINHTQPLVIINKSGTATADEVLKLAAQVRQAVSTKCAIKLEYEPELIGFGPLL